MAATILFVHGTGIREKQYLKYLALIESGAAEFLPGYAVMGCLWGPEVGAKFSAGGASVPSYQETGGGNEPTAEERDVALWSVLYSDPFYELRLLRHHPEPTLMPMQEIPAQKLIGDVREFTPSDALTAQLELCCLAEHLPIALDTVCASTVFDEAAQTAPAADAEHRQATARAVLAIALDLAAQDGHPPLSGHRRSAVLDLLIAELGADVRGIGDFLAKPFKGLAKWGVDQFLQRGRGSITDGVAPAGGDILRFLTHGDEARTLIEGAIGDYDEVVVLGHSLGGIMSVDLLIGKELANVKSLVTVGSQAPFLYEVGALPALEHPDALPDHMPPWLNVFDPRDVLSYQTTGVFPADQVTDVAVDNGEPFPEAHGAYFTNPAFWKALAEFLA